MGEGTRLLLGPPTKEAQALWKEESNSWLRELDHLETLYRALEKFDKYLSPPGAEWNAKSRAGFGIALILFLIPLARQRIQDAKDWFICDELRQIRLLHGRVSLNLGDVTETGLASGLGGRKGHAQRYGTPESIEQKRAEIEKYVAMENARGRKRKAVERAAKEFGLSKRQVYRYLRQSRFKIMLSFVTRLTVSHP